MSLFKAGAKHAFNMACTTVLPIAHADLCDPQAFYGEISMLMFTRLGDDLTEWTSAAEWGTRIDNATALPAEPALAPIRQLFGIGALAAPDRPEIKLSRQRKLFGNPEFTMTFEVDDTGDSNWNTLMGGMPVSGQEYAVWFGTEQRLYGGNTGIQATIVMNPNIPNSDEELQTISVTVTWKSTIPEVQDNIIA